LYSDTNNPKFLFIIHALPILPVHFPLENLTPTTIIVGLREIHGYSLQLNLDQARQQQDEWNREQS